MKYTIWNELHKKQHDFIFENLKPYGITKWNISAYRDRIRMVHDTPVAHMETLSNVYLDDTLIFTMFFVIHSKSIDGSVDFNLNMSVKHWNEKED